MNSENPFEKIYNTLQYAIEHGINPVLPETWDERYRNRQQELAGIITDDAERAKAIKEGIDRFNLKNLQ